MITIADDSNGPKWSIESLHGRQDELNILNKIADEKSSACVMLDGYTGSGKTSLVHAVNWEENGWIFVAQNFEKHLSTAPYSALNKAVAELVEIWCSDNENSSEDCKMRHLLDLVEKDMDILQNVIPGLFRVINKFLQRMPHSKLQLKRKHTMLSGSEKTSVSTRSLSSSIRDLSDSLRQQRDRIGNEKMGGDSVAIAAAFLRLFSFLSSTTKPIALSFDDVHYADASSMDILKLLARSVCTSNKKNANSNILLVLSYTDLLERNRVAFKNIRQIKMFESNVHCLQLRDWNVHTVNELVASLVKADLEESLPLSEVIHKKTGGNPFAVTQFVRFAREKGHFKFSSLTFKWQWGDIKTLDQCFSVSDNVAEMLAASMVKLSSTTSNMLMVASCLGHVIPTDVLVKYFAEGESVEESKDSSSLADLNLRAEELVGLLEGATKAGILVKSMTQGAYKWSNDLLQQATYESMPEPTRKTLHLRLGRLLWKISMERNEEWMIFMAANQMNRYSELESELCLGNEVAELNLQAAFLSLNKGAIYPALDLLSNAEKHMESTDRWSESYNLTHDILTTLAETKLRVGETGTAFQLATEVVRNSKSHEDAFPAHIVMLQCTVSGNDRNYDMGVERTLFLLKFYGEKHSWKFYLGQETLEKQKLRSKIKKLLPGGEIEGLLDLSEMTNKAFLRIQTLLVNHLAIYATYSPKYRSLGWFASARALKSACKHGISPYTNLAVVQLATHLRIDGNYKKASKYADIALKLTEALPRKLGSDHGLVRMIACGSVFSAVRSFNNCLNELMECREDLLRAGLVKESIGLARGYTITYLCVGLNLAAAKSDLDANTADAIHYGCPYGVEQKMRVLDQTIVNLISDVDEPTVLSGELMDQDDELEKVAGLGALRIRLGMDACRLMLCCIFCDWNTAETLIDDLLEQGDDRDGFLIRVHFRHCYVGLAAFALSRVEKDPKLRKKYLSIGKKMVKSFTNEMKYGSVNAFPIVQMLQAEQSPSKENYDRAIKATARLGLVHHEAYMCERAAEMFLAQREIEWGNHYISQAILLYGEWGATGKVNRLTKDYAELIQMSTLHDSENVSMQSRCRYSSKALDSLRIIDWRTFNKAVDSDLDFSYRSGISPSTVDRSSIRSSGSFRSAPV